MDTWLCLAGGNALGAFYAGAWQAIEEQDLRVTRIAGASIGGVMAAVVAGNPPGQRTAALRALCDRISRPPALLGRRAQVAAMMMQGHPLLFSPSWPGLWEILPGMPADNAAFRRRQMQRLLAEAVDFQRLNDGDIEVTLTALDAQTGEIVSYRNTDSPLGIEHLMATTALPALFAPVQIGGRTLVDPGTCENLPLRVLLDRKGPARILALDLFPLQGPVAETMDAIACRALDLTFAGQSVRAIAAADLAGRDFRHIVLHDPEDRFAGKAFDYSRPSIQRRVTLGLDLMRAALRDIAVPQPGAGGSAGP